MDESIMKGVRKLANLLGKSEDEILSLIEKKKEEMGGLINDYGALYGVASDFGIRRDELTEESNISFSKIKDVLTKKEVSVNVIGRVKRVLPTKTFQRKDGTTGKVARIIIADETGEIPVVLWDGHSEISNRVKFNDIVRIIKGNTKVSLFNDIERVEINLTTFSTIDINPEIDESLPELTEQIYTIKEVKGMIKDENERIAVSVVGRIVSDIESNEFERVDGSKGIRSPFFIEDETGTIRVVVWDDMKKIKEKGIDFGSIVKVRGIAKKGMFNDVEISTNSASNVEKSDAKLNLPELKKIGMQALKIGEIYHQYEALSEDEKRAFSLTTKGIVIRNFGVKEFESIDGSAGKVGSFIINDGTGSIRVVLWNELADFAEDVSEGDAVEIKNGKIKENMGNYEIHIRKKNNINLINKEEFANIEIPISSETIEKSVSELDDGDRNVKLIVKIANIDSDQRLIYPSCPVCGKKVINVGNNEWYCERCERSVEPVQKLMLRIIGTDVNGNEQIKIILFGDDAEKVIGMKVAEVLNLIGESGEQTVIEKLKKDLEGSVKTFIGHARFDKNFAEMRFYVDKVE